MKKMRTIILVAAMCGLSGCATTNKDPLEGINRGIYKFNDVADRYAMKPVAQAYKAVAPSPVRTGISNFFSNLGTLTTVVNDLLQLKFAQAFTDAGRFVINSTFGVAGFIDVASMDKIEKHNEDFGQTLGYWGVGSGAYIVLPILGPSTVRDAGGLAFDTVTSDPIIYLRNTRQYRAHNQVRAVQLLDKRTQLLDATDLVDNASIDPYAFMRDAYLQRRASLVQDGLVPKELLDEDFEPANDAPADKKSGLTEPMPALVNNQDQTPLAQDNAALNQPEVDKPALENAALDNTAQESAVLETTALESQIETLNPVQSPVENLPTEPQAQIQLEAIEDKAVNAAPATVEPSAAPANTTESTTLETVAVEPVALEQAPTAIEPVDTPAATVDAKTTLPESETSPSATNATVEMAPAKAVTLQPVTDVEQSEALPEKAVEATPENNVTERKEETTVVSAIDETLQAIEAKK